MHTNTYGSFHSFLVNVWPTPIIQYWTWMTRGSLSCETALWILFRWHWNEMNYTIFERICKPFIIAIIDAKIANKITINSEIFFLDQRVMTVNVHFCIIITYRFYFFIFFLAFAFPNFDLRFPCRLRIFDRKWACMFLNLLTFCFYEVFHILSPVPFSFFEH